MLKIAPTLGLVTLLGLVACESKPPTPTPEPKPTAAVADSPNGPKGSPGAANPHAGADPHGSMNPHGGNPHAGMPGMDNPHGGTPPGGMGGPKRETSIGWTLPSAWSEVDHPSSMRIATFKIPKAEGDSEDAEMSVMQAGGSIDANVKRWEGQFEGSPAAKTEKQEVNGLEVTVVSISGTFAGGGPMMGGGGGAKENWALLGAIVNTEPPHFFKMTGPKKTVEGSRGDFDSFVASFAKK
ncbi:MAG: hypothetical protein R3B72_48895 [Polyangiaceae bacterium]